MFHLGNILVRLDLLPLCLKARQTSWVSHKAEWGRRRVWKRRSKNPLSGRSVLVLHVQSLTSGHAVRLLICPPVLVPWLWGASVGSPRLQTVTTALALVLSSPFQNTTFLIWKLITVKSTGWYQVIKDRNYASVTKEPGLIVKEEKHRVHRGHLKPQHLAPFLNK